MALGVPILKHFGVICDYCILLEVYGTLPCFIAILQRETTSVTSYAFLGNKILPKWGLTLTTQNLLQEEKVDPL